MFFRPRYLSLVTTRRCTAACDHCCVGAGPRETDAIPVDRMHALIDEATRVPSFELIAFTGGECFLLGEALDELIGHATSRGYRTRVITNGYWAKNAERARSRVATARANGLGEMMVSTGTFHQRFVPVVRVIAAARAAAEAGILTRISVETCDQSQFDESVLRDALHDLIEAKRVILGQDVWITDAGGRGRSVVTHDRALESRPDAAHGRCAQILNVVSVTPRQDLIACCGFPQEHLPRMRLGSVAERALDAVLEAAPPELLKIWLHVEGPSGIAAFVARHVPGFRLPPAASICQACVALQRDAVAMSVLAAHGPRIAADVTSRFALLQQTPAAVA